MISDIHDNEYNTPLLSLKTLKSGNTSEDAEREIMKVLWWIGIVISLILFCLYSLGVYFTYFDDPQQFERTFSNKSK
jgi:hypothetical protein